MIKMKYLNKDRLKGRKILAFVLALTCALHSLPALGENQSIDINSDIKNEEPVKDNPLDELKYEINGDILLAQEETIPSTTQTQAPVYETEKFASVEEFMAFRDYLLNELNWKAAVNSLPIKDSSFPNRSKGYAKIYKQKLFNSVVLMMTLDSSMDIKDELEATDEFLDKDIHNFLKTSYFGSTMGFSLLFNEVINDSKKPSGKRLGLNLADLVFDKRDREIFESIYNPLLACVLRFETKKSFDSDEIRKVTAAITSAYEDSVATDFLQGEIYVSLPVATFDGYLLNNTKPLKNGAVPSLEGKTANEVALAAHDILDPLTGEVYDTIRLSDIMMGNRVSSY